MPFHSKNQLVHSKFVWIINKMNKLSNTQVWTSTESNKQAPFLDLCQLEVGVIPYCAYCDYFGLPENCKRKCKKFSVLYWPAFVHFCHVWSKSEIFPASLDYPIPSREPRGRAPWGHYLCILWVHIRGEMNMTTIQS